jgi:endoglycosylceramidase
MEQSGKVSNAERINVPGFLTEFGALSDSSSSVREINRILGLAERSFNSWTYWQFKYYNDVTTAARPATTESFYDNAGQLQSHKVAALSRPYFTAICGTPLSTSYDEVNRVLALEYTAGNCTQPTELFLGKGFELGFKAEFTPACSGCKVAVAQAPFYRVQLEGVSKGTRVKVVIRAD